MTHFHCIFAMYGCPKTEVKMLWSANWLNSLYCLKYACTLQDSQYTQLEKAIQNSTLCYLYVTGGAPPEFFDALQVNISIRSLEVWSEFYNTNYKHYMTIIYYMNPLSPTSEFSSCRC